MANQLSLVIVWSALVSSTIVRSVSAADAPAAEAPAADAPKKADEPAKADPSAADATPAEPKPPADPFAIPDPATPEELLKFIAGLANGRPQGKDRAEQAQFTTRANELILVVADKILAAQPELKTRAAAIDSKTKVLSKRYLSGDSDAGTQLTAIAEQLKTETNPELAKRARWIPFYMRAVKVAQNNGEGAAAVLAEVLPLLAAAPDDYSPAQLALNLGPAVQLAGESDKAVLQAYREIADALSKLENPEAVKLAEQLNAVLKRMELLGNPISISGTLMNGEAFDQASLKGKVVLVDFWATWCGPCIAEVPHVLECYEKYHDKGFEVIGISLDNDRERLEKFITDKQLPWPILFEPKEEEQGWSNPLVKLYGITGIPAMFVIDTGGNLISLTARGDRLTKILEEQLGPAESTKAAPEEKPAT